MNCSKKRKVAQIKENKQSLLNDTTELCLTRILKTEACTQLIGKCRPFRDRVYTPFKTICVFMKQVLSTDKSCKKAVAGLAVEHLISEKKVSAPMLAHIVRPDNAYLSQSLNH